MLRVPSWLRSLVCGPRISDLEATIDDLEQQVDELQPPEYPEIDYETVEWEAVENKLESIDGWHDRDTWYWLDSQYRLPTMDDFQNYAIHAAGELPEYHDEFFDCEDFAFAFMSMMAKRVRVNGVGVVISPPPEHHAFNVAICQDTVELWEPDGSEIVTDSDDPRYDLDAAWWLV